MERKRDRQKQSPSAASKFEGLDCWKVRLWINNTFAEPSASTQLVGLFKTFCFRKEFVSTRIQNFEKGFRRTITERGDYEFV